MRRAALVFLGVGSPLLLSSLLLGVTRAFVVLAVAFPIALMLFGASVGRRHEGSSGRLLPAVLAALLVVLEVSFLAMLNLRGRVSEAAWLLGLPLSTWILLVGVGLLPVLVVPWVYAATFGEHGLTEQDLGRVRGARERSGAE